MKRNIAETGLVLVLAGVFAAAPGLAQTPKTDNAPERQNTRASEGEAARSTLEVKPGEEVIKNKDLFERSGYFHPFLRMPRFVLADQRKIWTSPFHTSKKDAKYWAIFGGATGVLIAFDEQIQKNAPNPNWLVTLGTRGSYLGAAYTLIPISAGFYLLGSKTGNERFREAGLMSFEALIGSTILEEVLKVATDRERPLEGTGEGRFFHSPNRINAGFPSGHTINTFALASVFAHQYHDKLWVKLLVYGYAGAVGGARMAANRHFPSDTLAGAAMGWFIGDYIYAKRHNSLLDEGPKRSALDRLGGHVHIGGPAQPAALFSTEAEKSAALALRPAVQ